ncbi:MAG: hypothetical protein D6718_07205 [Acidobacteria bacterium]|nr:MAG: hypothetical protein D6718_07205 [Acidobacteriota bacterium]
MSGNRPDLEQRVAELERRLDRIERRVEALAAAGPEAWTVAEVPETAAPPTRSRGPRPAAWLALTGRTFVVLAGAFAWRALTESGVLPQEAGTALGIAYALVWLVMADRAAARDDRLSAGFHGLATALIAFPLVGEATAKFGFLTPTQGAVALSIAAGGALLLAWRRHLRGLAWTMTSAAVATAWALAVATQRFVPYALVLVGLAAVAQWLGYSRRWTVLASLATYVAAITLAGMTAIATLGPSERVRHLFEPEALAAVELIFLALSLAGGGIRAGWLGGELGAIEIAQLATAAAVAVAGAPWLVPAPRRWALGTAGALVALLAFSATLAAGRRGARTETARRGFAFLGLALVVWAAWLTLPAGPRAIGLAAAGAALLHLSRDGAGGLRAASGLLLLLAAAAPSGLLGTIHRGLFAPHPGAGAPGAACIAALVLGAVGSLPPLRGADRGWSTPLNVGRLFVVALVLAGAAALAVLAIASAAGAGAAWLSTLRTAALAALALAAAGLGRAPRFAVAGWLLYPALTVGGVKLLLEDLRVGRPATLVLSLAMFGLALIAAPRLARRPSPAGRGAASS